MPQNSFSNEVGFKELIANIKDYFRFLISKWKIILLCSFIGAIIGFTYAYLQKTYYTATLSFALEDEKSGGGLSGALSLASTFGIDLGTGTSGAFSGSNLSELMKSRLLVERTLLTKERINDEEITLAEMYIRMKGWRKRWESSKPEFSEKIKFVSNSDRNRFSLQQDSILGIIYSNLIKKNLSVAQKDKKVSIISIDVRTENELFSKLFAEALAKEVSDFYVDTKSRKSKMNVLILERQADSVRRELNDAITGVAAANDNTYNLNPALNVRKTPSTKRQIDVQTNVAILTELVKNLELAKVTLRKDTPLIQVIDTPILPLFKEKTSKILFAISGTLIFSSIAMLILILKRWWN